MVNKTTVKKRNTETGEYCRAAGIGEYHFFCGCRKINQYDKHASRVVDKKRGQDKLKKSTTKKSLRLRSAQIPEEIELGRSGAYAALKRNHDRLRVERKGISANRKRLEGNAKRRNDETTPGKWGMEFMIGK